MWRINSTVEISLLVTRHRQQIAIRWLCVLVWGSVIFLLSHESAEGSSLRSGIIVETLQSLGLGASADVLSPIIRKMAHLTMYAVLGALLMWAMAVRKQLTRQLMGYSILVACLFAISDEIHQAFIPGRSAEVRDVLLDTVGATIGSLLVSILLRRRR